MTTYILKNKEQIISEMPEDELIAYCKENGLKRMYFEVAYAFSDWNYIHRFCDRMTLCADSVETAKEFLVKAFYHDQEFDGEHGVIFHSIQYLD